MLIGRFGDTSGAPYLEARVSFPRLKIKIKAPPPGEADVSFLADTGADRTTIMPMDMGRFLIAESQLQNPLEIQGVSGTAIGFQEQAIVTFLEPKYGLRVYDVEVIIMQSTPRIMTVPSLLGRDIMSHWAMIIDRPSKKFTVRVVRADHTFKFDRQITGLQPLPAGIAPPLLRA